MLESRVLDKTSLTRACIVTILCTWYIVQELVYIKRYVHTSGNATWLKEPEGSWLFLRQQWIDSASYVIVTTVNLYHQLSKKMSKLVCMYCPCR